MNEKVSWEINEKDLADEHWQWVESVLELIYKSAFIHGYKHGKEDANVKE